MKAKAGFRGNISGAYFDCNRFSPELDAVLIEVAKEKGIRKQLAREIIFYVLQEIKMAMKRGEAENIILSTIGTWKVSPGMRKRVQKKADDKRHKLNSRGLEKPDTQKSGGREDSKGTA